MNTCGEFFNRRYLIINVAHCIGVRQGISRKAGKCLLSAIDLRMRTTNKQIKINFGTLRKISLHFLNAALIPLIFKYSLEELQERVRMEGLRPADLYFIRNRLEEALIRKKYELANNPKVGG